MQKYHISSDGAIFLRGVVFEKGFKVGKVWGSTLNLYHHVPTIDGLRGKKVITCYNYI